jgi:outer membrane protein assembly factor BamE (lipoprotein component of BamABCDE complex)
MSLPKRIASIALAAVLAACASISSRIKSHQAAFDASPPDVQAKIRKGVIAVGFTTDQVVMALGRPTRVYAKVTPKGAQEIWDYGLDTGLGTGAGTPYGDGGIVVGDAFFEEILRVVFEKGVAVDVVKRLR